MNRGKRFVKKTAIYTIGNFGSKILTFLMIPYYTFNIPTDEYGVYDVMIVTITLLMPVITLQTQEAIISGMIDKERDNSQIIKCTLSITLVNAVLFIVLFCIINPFFGIQYGWYFVAVLIIKSINTIVLQQVRGLSKTSLYAATGVIHTVVFLSFNIVFISVFHMGIEGLFVSEIIASAVGITIATARAPEIIKSLRVQSKKNELFRIIRYSLPLIPNNISWWLINASDRYVISFFLDSTANGIYAISYKFANILQTVTSLVYLAWQEISLEEYKSKDKDTFYSNFFNFYMKFLLSAVLIAICLTKFITVSFMASSYSDAWKYSAWLLMGVAYSALSAFLNSCYLANGNTGEILKGTLISGFINIAVDVALVNFIGIYAASLSTVVSAFILLLYRIRDNKKYYKLVVDYKAFWIMTGLCTAYSLLILLSEYYILDFCLLVPAIVLFILLNKNILGKVMKKILKKKAG